MEKLGLQPLVVGWDSLLPSRSFLWSLLSSTHKIEDRGVYTASFGRDVKPLVLGYL